MFLRMDALHRTQMTVMSFASPWALHLLDNISTYLQHSFIS